MDVQPLLQHTAWVRRLAHRLVFDADRVDDVVQRAWVELLEMRSTRHGEARSWMARVLKNAARQEGRAESTRRQHERAVPSPEPEETTLDLVERADLGRVLAQLVLELDEPFRTAVLMRYSEGLEPAEIARRLKVPGATVRNRIKRGLDRVRGRLDDRESRRAWSLALLPLAAASGEALAAAKMAPRTVAWMVAGLCVAGLVTVLSVRVVGGPEPAGPLIGAEESSGSVISETPTDVQASIGDPSNAQEERGVVRREERSACLIRGQVRTQQGTPVAGVEVVASADPGPRSLDGTGPHSASTDAEGRFELTWSSDVPERLALSVTHPTHGRASVRGQLPERSMDVGVLSLLPLQAQRGVVVDPLGRPVAGALVFGVFGNGADLLEWATRTEADGSFALACGPYGGAGAELCASAEGFGYVLSTDQSPDEEPGVLRLTRGVPLTGHVLDREGLPIEGARVAIDVALYRITNTGGQFPEWSPSIALTGPDGSFRHDGAVPGRTHLRIEAEGYCTTEAQVEVTDNGGAVDIAMGKWPASTTVRGVVVDGTTRRPLAGVDVAGQVITDGAGGFTIRKTAMNLSRGDWRGFFMVVKKAGYGEVHMTLPWSVDEEGIVVELYPEVRVHGLIVDPEGKPLADINVQWKPAADDQQPIGMPAPPYGHAKSGIDGTFTRAIPAGVYEVVTIYDRRFPKELYVHDFRPEPGEVVEWTFVMGEGARIEGRVLDSEGQRVPGAEVSAWVESERGWRSVAQTHSGWEGSFLIRGLEDAPTWLKVEAPGFTPWVERVKREAGAAVVRIEPTLTPGASLRGRVVGPSGRGVQGAWICLEVAGDGARRAVHGKHFAWEAGADGSFVLDDVPPGPWTVMVQPPAARAEALQRVRLDSVASDEQDVVWVLPGTGTVDDGEGTAGGSPGPPRRRSGGEAP